MICDRQRLIRLLWLLSAMACDGSDSNSNDVAVIENNGSLCFTQTGSEIQIRSSVAACIGNCRQLRSATCEAALTSDGLIVTSRVEVEETDSDECTTECSPAGAECAFAASGGGPLRVYFGEEQGTLDLPLSTPTSLFGIFECTELE